MAASLKHLVMGLKLILLICFLVAPAYGAFSWGIQDKMTDLDHPKAPKAAATLFKRPKSPRFYESALKELQELESKPFCNRIATKLLVDNCQLIDGKDEDSILQDSGRYIRDFVDAYGAALAICELERGTFTIPKQCAKLQEPALAKLALHQEPQLHMNTAEILDCLTALAMDHSTWNTWLHFRGQAVMYCHASRVDNEKAQTIHLHQQLVKVVAKLAKGVEIELQKRMDELDLRAQEAAEKIEQLNPQVAMLKDELLKAREYIAADLTDTMMKSSHAMQNNLQDAGDLQQLLRVLLKTVLENQSSISSSHAQSLSVLTEKADEELSGLMVIAAAAVASAAALQTQIETSRIEFEGLEHRQHNLERGMVRLLSIADNLTSEHEAHAHALDAASNLTYDILDVLGKTATQAANMQQSVFRDVKVGGLWPHVVCPVISLIYGSYGLPPSLMRNVGLFAVGEAVALLTSGTWTVNLGSFSLFSPSETEAELDMGLSTTSNVTESNL
ncbi:hypothetical protein P8C59_008774 [Phyllachora maydis]|uniref:Nuclear membrane fusion protein Kar5 n=1 Tax=Phyllachora maydis TaxID=1825666 RepID=A0AAD9MEX8_9PEZI|nr:hypothetical protein P8C59_008774 [Phyllachora maydis]